MYHNRLIMYYIRALLYDLVTISLRNLLVIMRDVLVQLRNGRNPVGTSIHLTVTKTLRRETMTKS